MAFTVELFDRTYGIAPMTSLALIPQRYSATAIGGYADAQIDVQGSTDALWDALRWLRYYVLIKNDNGSTVWAGFITRAEINLGGVTVGKSLDDMANYIAVAYTTTDASDTSQRSTTAYATDVNSVYRYGTKELLQTEGDLDDTQATARRDQALNILSAPVTTIQVNPGGTQVGGSLYCKGLWSTLGWRVYNNPGGVERFDVSGNWEHLLGWGLTSTGIGFEALEDGIHDIGAHFSALRVDDQIVVTGATNGGNNGTFTVTQAISQDISTIGPTTTISFEVTDDIKSSISIFSPIQATQLLLVSGSSVGGNNRYYYTNTDLAADHITVLPATVANSAAGVPVTLTQGHGVLVSSAMTLEYPSASVTVKALGTIVGQSFTLSVNSPFTVAEVYIRLKKVGSPSDSVQVFIQADIAGSPSLVSLESVSVLGSTIGDEMDWVKFTFTNTLSLTYGTTYWLVVWRTGSNSTTDYYMLDLAEDNTSASMATYASGLVKLWNGTAWVSRTRNADMPFQIWAKRATTTQMQDILTASGQFFVTTDIPTVSGIDSRQFRDADQTAQVEIENLMRAGVSGSGRYISSVSPERVIHITTEPSSTGSTNPMLRNDGALLDFAAQPWEPGRLPVGKWIDLAGIPANVDSLSGVSPFFCERAEYDVAAQNFSALEPKGAPNPWDVTTLV